MAGVRRKQAKAGSGALKEVPSVHMSRRPFGGIVTADATTMPRLKRRVKQIVLRFFARGYQFRKPPITLPHTRASPQSPVPVHRRARPALIGKGRAKIAGTS